MGEVRRIAGFVSALLLVSGLAMANPIGIGAGFSSSNSSASAFNLTRHVSNYDFDGGPFALNMALSKGEGAGWQEINSFTTEDPTIAPMVWGSQCGSLTMELQGDHDFSRLYERGPSHGVMSQNKDGEYKVQFAYSDDYPSTQCLAGSKGWFQFNVNDTTFMKFSKKPDGFGVFYVGSDSNSGDINPVGGWFTPPASWPKDTWIGFVGNGTDTTFIPLLAWPYHRDAAHASPRLKFYIHAMPNNGPVYFYINGVIAGTISDVTRSAILDKTGINIIAAGDGDNQPEMFLSPIQIERDW